MIYPKLVIDNIPLASKQDIAAMKLNAIAGRGSKKDFIDLYFLLNEFSLEQMIAFFRAKYPNHSEFAMLKSLTYFEDADDMPTPHIFSEFSWKQCKSRILEAFDKLNV